MSRHVHCSWTGIHTKRPARLKNFSYLGIHRYSLTFCTDRRRRLFEDASVVSLVLAQFLRVAGKEGFVVLAYCFMPDHIHLLIEGLREDADARKFITKSKQCSAHAYAESTGCRLWQPFGYEHVVRSEESTIAIARYILENPIRAGLARGVLEYPFSGSQVYDLRELLESFPETGTQVK